MNEYKFLVGTIRLCPPYTAVGFRSSTRPTRLLRQNSLAPKSAFHCSSSSGQGMYAQYVLRFFPSYTQPLGILHTSAVSRSACECDPAGDVLPALCFLFVGPIHETLHQGACAVGHTELFYDISVSKPHGTCIPTSSGLDIVRCS